jgi:hypothetical protein
MKWRTEYLNEKLLDVKHGVADKNILRCTNKADVRTRLNINKQYNNMKELNGACVEWVGQVAQSV